MPVCPGCEQRVPYDRLDLHLRYCAGLQRISPGDTVPIERLERRIAAMEAHVERRLQAVASDVDRRLQDLERPRRRRPPSRE